MPEKNHLRQKWRKCIKLQTWEYVNMYKTFGKTPNSRGHKFHKQHHPTSDITSLNVSVHCVLLRNVLLRAEVKSRRLHWILRYQSGISHPLFASYLAAFQWRFSHKLHAVRQFLQLLSEFTIFDSLRYVWDGSCFIDVVNLAKFIFTFQLYHM